MLYLESIFKDVDGKLTEFNIHQDIREKVTKYCPEATVHLDKIDAEIISLKEKGFDFIYSAIIDPLRFKLSEKT
jgi:hypothetical protein